MAKSINMDTQIGPSAQGMQAVDMTRESIYGQGPSYPQGQYATGVDFGQAISKENNKIRQITIEEVNKGYIVKVGCHTFAIENSASLLAKLSQYIIEPQKTEEKWYKGELF